MPEVGDVVRLPVKGKSIPVRVKSVRLGGEHFGIQHVELICSMDVLSLRQRGSPGFALSGRPCSYAGSMLYVCICCLCFSDLFHRYEALTSVTLRLVLVASLRVLRFKDPPRPA
jgi:hypothetical protein